MQDILTGVQFCVIVMRKDLVAFLVSQFSNPSRPFDGTASGLLKFARVENPSDVGK